MGRPTSAPARKAGGIVKADGGEGATAGARPRSSALDVRCAAMGGADEEGRAALAAGSTGSTDGAAGGPGFAVAGGAPKIGRRSGGDDCGYFDGGPGGALASGGGGAVGEVETGAEATGVRKFAPDCAGVEGGCGGAGAGRGARAPEAGAAADGFGR